MAENINESSHSSEPTTPARPRIRRLVAIAIGLVTIAGIGLGLRSYLQIQHTKQIAKQIEDGTYPFQNEIIAPEDPRFSPPDPNTINEWGYQTAAELQQLARQFHFEFNISTIHDGGTNANEPDRISVRFERPDGIYGVTVVRGTYAEAWSLRTAEQQENFYRKSYNDYYEFEKLVEEVMGNWMPPKPRPRAAIEMLTRRRDFGVALRMALEPGGPINEDFQWQDWKWTLHRDAEGYRRSLRFHFPDWGDNYPELDINRTQD